MRPIETLGKWAMLATGFIILVDVIMMGLAIHTLVGLTDLQSSGSGPNLDQLAADVVITYDLALLWHLFFLICVYVVNGIWIYRAVANSGLIYPDTKRIRPGWAIGWHFIPILNFWKPYVAMRQTWNTSTRGDRDMDARAPALLKLWWTAWLITTLLGTLSVTFYETYTLDGYLASSTADMLGAVTSIISSIFFLRIVRGITEAQAHASIDEVFR